MENTVSYTPRELRKKQRRFEWERRGANGKVAIIITFIVLLIYALSLLYPLLWVLMNSFKDGREFMDNKFAFPSTWNFHNYVDAWNIELGYKKTLTDQMLGRTGHTVYLWESFLNSVWMTLERTILELLVATPLAYVIAKYRFPGSQVLYAIVVFIQIIPLVGALPANYQWINGILGLADNPFSMIPVWLSGLTFSFILLYSAFSSLPYAYIESGLIDGASHFKIFSRIMLPQVKPVVGALFVVNSISYWGDYMTPYLFMKDYPTISLAIYNLQEDAERSPTGIPLFFAIIIISIIPTVLLFLLCQKLIMQNYGGGGIKG